jgi:hypothetical protein
MRTHSSISIVSSSMRTIGFMCCPPAGCLPSPAHLAEGIEREVDHAPLAHGDPAISAVAVMP